MSYPIAARARASKAYLNSKISRQRPPDSKYNINVSLSDTISLNRDIEDSRPEVCKSIKYVLSNFCVYLMTTMMIIRFICTWHRNDQP